eukprot:g30118.t1
MGCCGSTIKDNEISKATAQSFFKLEGLPLSLTVVKLDNSRLELRIVGLDCPEELQRLEVALQKLGQSGTPKERKRRLCLTSGTLLKVGSHIDQTFELTVKKKIRSPIKDYMTASPSTQVEVEEATAQSICEELPAAKMLMSQVRDAKGLLRLFDSASQEHSGKSSDPYSFAAQEHSSTSSYPVARIPSSGSIGGFVNGLNQKVVNEDLPLPLRWTQNKLEYNIRPSSAGFVVDGYQKYVGMGLVHRSMKEMLNSLPDLQKIVVCDVVNWNTYMLMAVAGSTTKQATDKLGLIVQRRLVDDAISDKINNWMDRYLMVCSSGDSAYHVLVGKLLHGIVRALHFALEEVKQAEPREAVAERCAILLRCKEQVGQERALIAAKGNSRPHGKNADRALIRPRYDLDTLTLSGNKMGM